MKSLAKVALLVFISIGLFACAAPKELSLKIDQQRLEEAWEKAYNTALTQNYVPHSLDKKKMLAHVYRREEFVGGLRSNLHIKLHLVKSKADEEEGAKTDGVEYPVLRLEGRDEAEADDVKQVAMDMEEIARQVRRCCGVAEEIKKP
jgi:hypothetical protein